MKHQLIIIGGGPGGYTAAIRGAQLGLDVALIEQRYLGGTCLNRGCIPTKALLHTAELYHKGKEEFSSLGLQVEGLSYDIQAVWQRKNQVVAQLRQGIEQLIKGNKIAYYPGTGTIIGSNQVQVKGENEQDITELEAEHILIASGSSSFVPPIPGADSPGILTSDQLLSEDIDPFPQGLPKTLTIIGGGVIGCEFAQFFADMGCQVTIIEAMERILPMVDKEISQNLAMILKKKGVSIHTGSLVQQIEYQQGQSICTCQDKKEEFQVSSELTLMCIGRKPNLEALLAPDITLNTGRGGVIIVDEQFRTSMPGVYAIGDVIGGMQLAHKAEAEGQAAVAYIAGEKPRTRLDLIPSCIYTSPEIATVGATEAQLKEEGCPVLVGKVLMSTNGKSLVESAERGFIKLVFHGETRKLLGAAMMCNRATDMLSELTLAIEQGLTDHELSAIVRPHPTFNEAITEAAEAASGRAIHTMPKRGR